MSAVRIELALFGAFAVIAVFMLTNPLGSMGENSQMIERAEHTVRTRLRDPDSASFRSVFVTPNGLMVCGEVNAKNGFGGYVGYRAFLAVGDSVDIAQDGESSALAQSRSAVCMDKSPRAKK